MIENTLAALCLLLFLNPARLIIQTWFHCDQLVKKIGSFFVLGSTLIPLVVFYVVYFLKIPFTQINVLCVLMVLNGITLLSTIRMRKDQKSPNHKTLRKQQNHIQAALFFLGTLVFLFPYLFSHQPIVGGDSPHYLYNATRLIKDGVPPIVLDRNIVYFLPAIGQELFGISIENMMKIIVFGYELTFISVSVLMAQKWMQTKLLIPFGVTMIFSLSLYNLSKFTIPFFMALTVMLMVIEGLEKVKLRSEWLFIAYLWGILFNLHGVIAFASLGILAPLILAKLVSQKVAMTTVLLGLIVFLGSAQPLIFNQGGRLVEGFVRPIQRAIGMTTKESFSGTVPTTEQEKIAVLVNEYTVTKPSLSRFPLHWDSFVQTYSPVVLLATLIGLWLMWRDTSAVKKISRQNIIWTTVCFLLLSQQEFFGINWFANRFIFASAPLFFIAVFSAFDKISLQLKKPALAYYASLALVVLPTSMVGFGKITSLSASIKPEEHQFIQDIARKYPQEKVIFVAAGDSQWIQALAPQWRVFRSNHQAICGDDSAKSYVEESLWEVGKAFSEKVTVEQSKNIFKKYANGSNYLIYLDTKNYHCINGNLFPGTEYPLLAQNEGLMLLEHK